LPAMWAMGCLPAAAILRTPARVPGPGWMVLGAQAAAGRAGLANVVRAAPLWLPLVTLAAVLLGVQILRLLVARLPARTRLVVPPGGAAEPQAPIATSPQVEKRR